MPDAGVEIKTATKHVEAAIRVISGRGFDSPRLHSTRCARSWQASAEVNNRTCAGPLRGRRSSESNALSKRSASKGYSMTASAPADTFFVYILRCADGSLYIGHTSNVDERVKVHNEGRGALWTSCRRPVALVFEESHCSELKAIARERQLKRWSHAKKLALINGDRATLKSLAKRQVY